MRKLSMLALVTLALGGCGGSREQAKSATEVSGGEVQAARGEADGTPGYDADVQWSDCEWRDPAKVKKQQAQAARDQQQIDRSDAQGTSGYDADVDWDACGWHQDGR
jgi:hypothetical protein